MTGSPLKRVAAIAKTILADGRNGSAGLRNGQSAPEQDWRARAAAAEARLSQLERLLAGRRDLVFLWDDAGAERRFGRLESWSAGETPTLEAVRAMLAPSDSDRLAEALERLLTRGEPFVLQARTHRGDGSDGDLEFEGSTAGGAAALRVREATAPKTGAAERDGAEADRLRRMLEMAPWPIWRRGPDDRLVWANTRYAEAVDASSPAEAVSRNEILASSSGTGPIRRQSLVIDGQPRVFDLFELPLAEGAVGFALDVTEGEAARAELERQTQAQHALLDTLDTAVVIFDSDKHLSFFNPAFAELARLSSRSLAENPHHAEVLDMMRAQRRLPEEINFRAWKERILDLHATLREPSSEVWHLADGSTWHVVAQPHPAGGLIFTYEDVTERLALERSYNALIGVQRATLDHLFEGVALFGTDGRLELFNPAFAALWGLDPALLADRPHMEQIFEACARRHPEPAFWDRLKSAIAGIRSEQALPSGRIERQDDVVVEYASVPLPDGATLLTWLDVTDTMRIQRALRERADALETADRLKGVFISHISYQLRTPLNTIIGFGEILEQEYFGALTERQHEYTRGILAASEELRRLVGDMLDLAMIEAGTLRLDFESFDIREFLERVAATARDRFGEDTQIEIDCPNDVGTIRADERRVMQVMQHLVTNAVQSAAPGDVLVLGGGRDDEEVRLWVEDKGPGIAPEDQDAVFEKFETRPVGDGKKGAGLGLTLVRSLVELHGGWVELLSEAGQGTRVVCHLPKGDHASIIGAK